MIIGIDLNNVLRAFNEQVKTYYEKCFNVEVDLEGTNIEDVDIDKTFVFKDRLERNRFYYEDYPFELFGCGTTMSCFLLPKLNEWIKILEEKGHKVYITSLDEEILSIPSTLFFISKIGLKCRHVIMPKKLKELNDKIDVLVTANYNALRRGSNHFAIVGVKRGYNEKVIDKADIVINNLEELFEMNVRDLKKKNKSWFNFKFSLNF